MATKTSADAQQAPRSDSTASSALTNLDPHGVKTKLELDDFLRLLLQSPNAIQLPLEKNRTEPADSELPDSKATRPKRTLPKNREEAFKFYNRGGLSLQQMLSQRERLPQQSTSSDQHHAIAPRSELLPDITNEEVFNFYNRGGQAPQQSLDHSGRLSRRSDFKGPRGAMVKRDVDAEPTGSKHMLEISPPSDGPIELRNGTAVRIPEIEIPGFKRVISSPKVVGVAEGIPIHTSIARYEMNQSNVTALSCTVDKELEAYQARVLEVFGFVLLGIFGVFVIVTSIRIYVYRRKEKRKKRHEEEAVGMESATGLQRVEIGGEGSGGVVYSVDLNQV